MAVWTGGAQWEPRPDPATGTSLWSEVDGGVAYPNIIIGTIDYARHGISCSWNVGRDWWFDVPQPSTVFAELRGDWEADIAAGETLVLRADPAGSLWTGWVDEVQVEEIAGDEASLVTRVTGGNAITRMSRVEILASEAKSLPAQTITERVKALVVMAGMPTPVVHVVAGFSGGAYVDLPAKTNVTGSVLGMLVTAEAEANCIVEVGPDGSFWIQPRAPEDEGYEPVPVQLTGSENPFAYTKAKASAAHVINSWSFGTKNIPYATSIRDYGRKDYAVEWAGAEAQYSTGLMEALSGLQPQHSVSLRVANRMSPLAILTPFAFVQWDDVVWQSMSIYHQVTTRGWDMVIALDPTADVLSGGEPPAPEPPPTTARRTDTFISTKSAYVVKTPGGLETGNGASENLLVGLLSDGNLCRAMISASVAWAGKPTSGCGRRPGTACRRGPVRRSSPAGSPRLGRRAATAPNAASPAPTRPPGQARPRQPPTR
jgi:hypothetical protein